MELCKLCGLKEATQTNSHIITLALIKEALNHSNIKERDYDVTFMLSNTDIPKSYFGRNVSPEHIEEVLGRSLAEKEISENKNPFTEDFIFCPDCEKKISLLETEFINRVYSKLNSLKNIEKLPADKKQNRLYSLNLFETKVTYLFCYSIFFRTSIASENGHKLDQKIKEHLRKTLDSCLSLKVEKLTNRIMELKKSDLKFPVILCFLEDFETSDKTGNLIFLNKSKQPHFIWANDVALFLFEKDSHISSSVEFLFGFSQALIYKEYFTTERKKMNICVLTNKKREKIIDGTLKFMAKENMKFFKLLFNDMCKKLFRRRGTVDEQNLFGYHFSNLYTNKDVTNKKEAFIKAFTATFNIKD